MPGLSVGTTRLAAAIPWLWLKQPGMRSENVVGTIDGDAGAWSLAHVVSGDRRLMADSRGPRPAP